MDKLNQNSFAIASGICSLLFHLGCYLLIAIMGKGSLVKLSNLLFHRMAFSNIIHMKISVGETLFDAFSSFLFWCSFGYLLAFIYNKFI